MIITPELEKLWEPYSEGGVVTIAKAMAWLHKIANELRLDSGVIDLIVVEVLLEVEKGREFALDMCTCGCGMTQPHTDILHYMGKRMKERGAEMEQARSQIMVERWQNQINAYVETKLNPPGLNRRQRLWRFLNKPRHVTNIVRKKKVGRFSELNSG